MNYEKILHAYVRDESQTLWRAVGKWYEELDVLIKAAFKACEQIKVIFEFNVEKKANFNPGK
jgi:hypothetical protein